MMITIISHSLANVGQGPPFFFYTILKGMAKWVRGEKVTLEQNMKKYDYKHNLRKYPIQIITNGRNNNNNNNK